MTRAFLRAGHLPTLVASFLYFDVSFMVWVLLAPLAVLIAKDLHLNAGQKGLMVAVPVLAGAAIRIVAGALADIFKPRRVGAVMQAIVIGGLLAARTFGLDSFGGLLALGILLGVAGASFAVALPLASSWYPPEHQGAALGVAGAGNSGTVLAALFAPTLAAQVGWRNVIGLAAIPLAIVLALFLLLARDSSSTQPRRSLPDYLDALRAKDAWWLMAFYCVTFGGFVGLASFLPIYFNDQYGLAPIDAGYCTAACVFCGSFARPFGGALADRWGGIRTLGFVYGGAGLLLAILARGVASAAIAAPLLAATMATLGVGNGSVFQIVPQRFRRSIGVVTGLVGATGGVGGFALAAGLGYAKQFFGAYGVGLGFFAALSFAALAAAANVGSRWRRTWLAPQPAAA